MPKKQCNIRMSKATRAKLDDLTARYGTQAEAVAVAIHNLWKEELVKARVRQVIPAMSADPATTPSPHSAPRSR